MAPIVFIADMACDSGSDSEGSEQQGDDSPTFILGLGVNESRVRRGNRPHNSVNRRENLRGRRSLFAHHPISRAEEACITSSIENNENHLSSIINHDLHLDKSLDLDHFKSWSRNSHCHRLLLLRRREGLLDITVRTVALIRRNHQLQIRLAALQAETKEFVRSVMSNPENQEIKLETIELGKGDDDYSPMELEDEVDSDCNSVDN